MTENTPTEGKETKKEVTIVTPEIPPSWLSEVPSDQRVVIHVGVKKGADTKYAQYWKVPITDEEAKERYNVTLAELTAAGVRNLAYRCNNSSAFSEDGTCNHEELQKVADAYKAGQRSSGGEGVKAKAAAFKNIEAAAGGALSQEEILALIKREAAKRIKATK